MFSAQIQVTSKRKSGRFVEVGFDHNDGYLPILTIDETRYLVRETTSDADFGIGRSFELTKLGGGEYKVFVACEVASKANFCDCEGFRRFGYCKHIDALRYLILMGVIDEQVAPVLEQGHPEPADLYDCEEMGMFC